MDHSFTLGVESKLARMLKYQGRDGEAMDLINLCVNQLTRLQGADHPEVKVCVAMRDTWV
jgi:hypothetical protein